MSGEQQLKQMIHVDEAIFLLIIYKLFFLEVTVIFFLPVTQTILNANMVIVSVRHCTIALSNCSTAFFASSVSASDLSSQSVLQ